MKASSGLESDGATGSTIPEVSSAKDIISEIRIQYLGIRTIDEGAK